MENKHFSITPSGDETVTITNKQTGERLTLDEQAAKALHDIVMQLINEVDEPEIPPKPHKVRKVKTKSKAVNIAPTASSGIDLNDKRLWVIGSVVVMVLFVCCICPLLVGLFNPQPKPVAKEVQPTEASADNSTSESVADTPTPEPVDMPIPTNTPTPECFECIADLSRDYIKSRLEDDGLAYTFVSNINDDGYLVSVGASLETEVTIALTGPDDRLTSIISQIKFSPEHPEVTADDLFAMGLLLTVAFPDWDGYEWLKNHVTIGTKETNGNIDFAYHKDAMVSFVADENQIIVMALITYGSPKFYSKARIS
jgi:hypothetical protein